MNERELFQLKNNPLGRPVLLWKTWSISGLALLFPEAFPRRSGSNGKHHPHTIIRFYVQSCFRFHVLLKVGGHINKASRRRDFIVCYFLRTWQIILVGIANI